MKLSEDNAKRLSKLVWRERARRWLPLVAAAVILFSALTFFLVHQLNKSDRTVDVRVHDGTVSETKHGNAARGASVVHVHLDDGRDVDAFSMLRVVPAAGAHVVVNESRHASGRLTYDVLRVSD
jgi:hypothetical protein